MAHACLEHGVSQRRACNILEIDRSTVRYSSVRPDDADLRKAIRGVAQERRRFGYRRIGVMLERQGIHMNHKKLLRLYREEKLQVRKRGGRKRALGTRRPMVLPSRINERWSLDFVSDAFTDAVGSAFWLLLMITAVSVWRLWLIPHYLAPVSHASLMPSLPNGAASPRRLFLITGRSSRAWRF